MVTKLILFCVGAGVLCVGFLGVAHGRKGIIIRESHPGEEHAAAPGTSDVRDPERRQANMNSLPALDARGFDGPHEITRPELVKLMARSRPLSEDENAHLDRGCPGLACLYQGLGEKRWPESARGTVAYLTLEDALKRRCPDGQENFVFLKQGCWVSGKPPKPDPGTGQVPLGSLIRAKPGLYTFNYAVYFPATATYAWMNHRDYGFPLNRIKPQKAYLSSSPPPLDEDTRPAQLYCSTCR